MKTSKFLCRLGLLLLLLTIPGSCVHEWGKVKTPLERLNPHYRFPRQVLEVEFEVATDNSAQLALFKQILADYNALHPQVSIKLFNKRQGNFALHPDISLVPLRDCDREHPLPRLAPAWVEAELLDRLDEKSYLSACIEKRLYGIPRQIALGTVLIYNKSLLRQAGLDRPPRDTVELAEWAKRLTVYDGQGKIVQAGWAAPWTGLRPFVPPELDLKNENAALVNRSFIRQKPVWPDVKTRNEVLADFKPFLFCFLDGSAHSYLFRDDYFMVNFSNPDMINALDYYQKFIWEFKSANILFPHPAICLKQGLAAMAYLDPDYYHELKQEAGQWEWGVAPQVIGKLPYGKFLPSFVPHPGMTWAVTTLDKEKIDVCWDILLFTFLNHDLPLAQSADAYPLLQEHWDTEYAKNHYLNTVVKQLQFRPVIMTELHPMRHKLEALLGEAVCRVAATSVLAEKALNDLAVRSDILLRYTSW